MTRLADTPPVPTAPQASTLRPPRIVKLLNPVAKALLRAGVPMGPNGLLTVRGRSSGLARTTPVAVIELDGRRWIWSPWGETHWVRNLRAAGGATVTVHGRPGEVRATELSAPERVSFFREVLGPLARRVPFGPTFIRIADGVDLSRPREAAEGRVVFELRATDDQDPWSGIGGPPERTSSQGRQPSSAGPAGGSVGGVGNRTVNLARSASTVRQV